MAIEFDGKGNITSTTEDGVVAVKLYSLEKKIEDLQNQLQQKENIIKEVREYITSYINQFNGVYPPVDMRYLDLNKILEILDKEKV